MMKARGTESSENSAEVISRAKRKARRKEAIAYQKQHCRHLEGHDIGGGEVQCTCGTILKGRQIPTNFDTIPPVNSKEWFERQKRMGRRVAV